MAEGGRSGVMYVLVDGRLDVTRQGSLVSTVQEPGVVIGEIAVLLDIGHSATVTAVTPTRVHVVEDPLGFLAEDPAHLLEVTRALARRLNRLTGYLTDVKAQYAGLGGHLGLVDQVLAELTFGELPEVEPGSERDPEPYA